MLQEEMDALSSELREVREARHVLRAVRTEAAQAIQAVSGIKEHPEEAARGLAPAAAAAGMGAGEAAVPLEAAVPQGVAARLDIAEQELVALAVSHPLVATLP